VKQLSYLVAAQMHGRRNDMRRLFAAQLNDVFPQIGLDNAVASRLKRLIKFDLF
jgi:hypothetical protein